MIFTPLPLVGAFRIDLDRREDSRGFFARMVCETEFAAHGLNTRWVQMNTSLTGEAGSVRGLHFQRPPMAEVKLVKCVAGAILDVIVDLRAGSGTFGHWHGVELSAENRTMIYVPEGFAHGFQTLTSDCELIYLHSCAYSASHEGGLRHDDPALAIGWPLPVSGLSPRDAAHPLLTGIEAIQP
ncbi:MAG: dTDP-4-dehydrorhamnose 3,5-epimerase family protein [Caulobacteraceae bacterium]|nr:dTDP-4-dehydrorhamnose 3,5-epimerase family protein [Caulobacteraceae bacterium]